MWALPELSEWEYIPQLMFRIGPTRDNLPTDWDVLYPFAQSQMLTPEDTELLAGVCHNFAHAKRAGVNPLSIAPVNQE